MPTDDFALDRRSEADENDRPVSAAAPTLLPTTSNGLLVVAPTGIVTDVAERENAWLAAGKRLSLFRRLTTSGAPTTGLWCSTTTRGARCSPAGGRSAT